MTLLSDSIITQFLADTIPAEAFPAPVWGPIGEDVYKRSYSRNIVEDDGAVSPGWVWKIPASRTNEVWAETVRRVVLGNLAYAPDNAHQDGEAVKLFRFIYEFKLVPAGRQLWMSGVPDAALKNCHRAGWSRDTSDHFRFLASHLFMGGGVGANYSAHYRERGTKVLGNIEVGLYCHPDHQDYNAVKASSDGLWWDETDAPADNVQYIRVEDTREGWVDAWVQLIRIAHEKGTRSVLFDLTAVRPHGAPLRSFGGRASGPAPLAGSIVSITRVLQGAANQNRFLSAIEAMSIDHHIAAAVVAGGTRRSARMSQLNWNDPEIFDFIKHKRNDPSVSWSTNISVVVDDDFQAALSGGDAHALDVMEAIAEGMVKDGEPGLYNLALAQVGELRDVAATNPCGEAILEEHFDTETGKGSASGESCNLGSVDLDAIGANIDEAVVAFKLMSRFLYRATLAPIYDKDQAEIENRNRRLGVGLMGLQGWAAAHNNRLSDLPYNKNLMEALTLFRLVCRVSADEIADELNLPRPIKVTAVAPTGTIAQLRGTTSGIHPVYARYFVRRVQYSDHDPRLLEMGAKGYHIEDSVYSAHTKVVSIPVADIILNRHPEALVQQADEISVDSFLEVQAAVQQTFCGGTDGQAISATANIPAAGVEPGRLAEILIKHLPNIKGATVFPAVSRPQTPITSISKTEWENLVSEIAEKIGAGDSNDGECVSGACPIR